MTTKHLNLLFTLEAIDRLGGFGAAAGEMGISQAAVSLRIKKLETELGISLVSRTTRKVALTREGRYLAEVSRGAMKTMENGLADIQSQTREGKISVEILSSVAVKWLIPRVGRFYEHFPEVEIQILAHDLSSSSGLSSADVAIQMASGPVEGCHSTFLTPDSMFPVCHPSFAERFSKPPVIDDLAEMTLLEDEMAVADGSGCDWVHWFEHFAPDTDLPAKRLFFSRADLALNAAIANQGVAIGRASICIDDIDNGSLCAPIGGAVRTPWSLYLFSRSQSNETYKVKVFKDWLLDEFGRSADLARQLGVWF